MKKLDVGQTIQIAANIGVLAGIIFIAVEIRQNQTAFYEEAEMNALDSFNDFRELIAENEQLAMIWLTGRRGGELTPIERSRFDYLCQNFFFLLASSYVRYDQGRRDATVMLARGSMTNSPGLRECWQLLRSIMIAFEYDAFVLAVENGD